MSKRQKKLNKIYDAVRGIVGVRVEGEPESEGGHFYLCPSCRQSVDMRDLRQVIHHEQPGHKPVATRKTKRASRTKRAR